MPEEPDTLIEKLRQVAALKAGEQFPDWLIGTSGWGEPLAELCREAADRLEKLEKYQRLEDMIENYPKE